MGWEGKLGDVRWGKLSMGQGERGRRRGSDDDQTNLVDVMDVSVDCFEFNQSAY